MKEAKKKNKRRSKDKLLLFNGKYINIVNNKKYFIRTYGCQMMNMILKILKLY